MKTQKAVLAATLVFTLLGAFIAVTYAVSRPVFFVAIGIFAGIGFFTSAIALFEWLENPQDEFEATESTDKTIAEIYDFKKYKNKW